MFIVCNFSGSSVYIIRSLNFSPRHIFFIAFYINTNVWVNIFTVFEYMDSIVGWNYHVEKPRTKYIRPKSYGANFSWDKRTRRTAK